MKKVDSIVAYNEILNIFHGSKYETNAYFLEEDIKTLISENGLFFERFADNLLLFEYIKPFNFFKVYYYLKNLSFPLNIKTDTAHHLLNLMLHRKLRRGLTVFGCYFR